MRMIDSLLDPDGFAAKGYPVLDGGIPVLTPEPYRYLARMHTLMTAVDGEFASKIDQYSLFAREQPWRSEALLRCRDGTAHQRGSFADWLSWLAPFADRDASFQVKYEDVNSTGVFDAGDYLVRDWSRGPGFEREVSIMKDSAMEWIDSFCPERDSVLVLGLGASRLPEELRQAFSRVVGMDHRFALAAVSLSVRRGLERFWDVRHYNVEGPLGHATSYPCRFQENESRDPGDLEIVLGDPRHTPFRPGGFSAIASFIYTDVWPLSQLLPEIRRLLSPHGLFVSFGPLRYYFEDPEEGYAGDEMLERFRREGFRIEGHRWVEYPWSPLSGTLSDMRQDCLCFAARLDGVDP